MITPATAAASFSFCILILNSKTEVVCASGREGPGRAAPLGQSHNDYPNTLFVFAEFGLLNCVLRDAKCLGSHIHGAEIDVIGFLAIFDLVDRHREHFLVLHTGKARDCIHHGFLGLFCGWCATSATSQERAGDGQAEDYRATGKLHRVSRMVVIGLFVVERLTAGAVTDKEAL